MDRNLTIGLIASLVLHAVLAFWAGSLAPKPRPIAVLPKDLVRTVREQVELPKPPPPPPKPEPKPEPKPDELPKVAEAPPKTAPPKHTPQPKSDQAAPKTPPTTPAPLVLSKTYGAAGDEGVVVHTGHDDVLGDPGVDPTDDNVRRRPVQDDGAAKNAGGEGPVAEKEARKIEIVQARPKEACDKFIEWPEGAESGGRVVEVTLQLEIGEDGSVRRIKLLRGAGDPFDAQAIKDIKRCPFAVGTRDGKPMVSKIAFVVAFKPRS